MPPPPDITNLFTIPAGAPFSATLARGLAARLSGGPFALADVTIYLPTRRAMRSMTEIFAREARGATLLPDFRPLGDVDEDELLLDPLADPLESKPAIAPLRRRLLLAALIRRWSEARDYGRIGFGQAAGLAKSLAAVMDEAETQGADLVKLGELAPLSLAEHWAEVKEFLSLIHSEWPNILNAEDRVNPAAHRNDALRALAKRLAGHPPDRLIIAAGSTGSIPATAELLGVIARLPKGFVVLPGLDRDLDGDSWSRLDRGHPQFALKQLLERIGVRREDVSDWVGSAGTPQRERILREVLRPAPTTDAWRALAVGNVDELAAGLDGLSLIAAADPAEESSVIALLLREALETPSRTAALVTRDRALARRVTAELGRWDIAIDDSAGRPLAQTEVGAFLCLIAEAADSGFAPVPLLALLKHPLAAMGEGAAVFRGRARELDLALRGPRPDSGLVGIAAAIAGADDGLKQWFAQVAGALAPFAEILARPEVALGPALAAHIAATERLAPEKSLWRGPAGSIAHQFVRELSEAAAGLPPIEARSYAATFRTLIEEPSVRPPFGRHPRLAILGPLEARLQHFDLVVLGGLNEGSWPPSAADDPWFSRPMRRTLGLEQPERAIGLSAHDFATLAAAPRVVLTRARKAEGAPTVASRWLQRLDQLARGLKLDHSLASRTDYPRIVAAFADPGAPERIKPPSPRPPVAARPRRLSFTEIETWVRDPYSIYAKRILNLRPLDPLDAEVGPLERGTALHRALELFVRRFPRELPADAAMHLVAIADEIFRDVPKATLAIWRPRFLRAALWFVELERERRPAIAESFVEIKGERPFPGPAGDFILHGRADRIDRLRAGGGVILDYKTGAPPSNPQVLAHLAPQLPLEGAVLMAGGFKEIGPLDPVELAYVRISGGAQAGEYKPIKADANEIALEAAERLVRRIAQFDDETMAYESRVGPIFAKYAGDYDHLARVREWSASGWRGEGE